MDLDNNYGGQIALFLCSFVGLSIWLCFWVVYSSRMFGFIVSKALYIALFRKYGSDFSIQSLHIAPLGGKIMFKNLIYTTKNASLHIFDGYFVINWWSLLKRKWRKTKYESKITGFLSGVEYIVYNNTARYDLIELLKMRRSGQTVNIQETVSGNEECLSILFLLLLSYSIF